METFRPDFTFDAFIPTPSCARAYRLARALADERPTAPRLLLLHGLPGTGKTHLLHAIGQASSRRTPSSRVRTVAAADLADDLAGAIRLDRMDAFRQKYADIDLLLIDDLHELRSKPATQTEIALHVRVWIDTGMRIAAASGAPPASLPALAAGLRQVPTARWVGLKRATAPESRHLLATLLARSARTMHPLLLQQAARHSGGDVRRLVGAVTQLTMVGDRLAAGASPPWLAARRLAARCSGRPGRGVDR